MRKKNILTNNREIYEKFNMLNFSPEIILKNVKFLQIEKIIRNVNKNSKILDMEVIGNYILIRKKAPLDFDVYFTG
jgi:hypothetical protein